MKNKTINVKEIRTLDAMTNVNKVMINVEQVNSKVRRVIY